MIDVVFEDNHLLVLNKPPGLLTQPSGTSRESLEEKAKNWLKDKYNKPGNVFLEAIHRLDKAASGIVVFAKTSKALSRLTAEVRNRNVKKIYHVLVGKHPPKNFGVLEHYLVHDNFRATVVDKEVSGAKPAKLHYKVIIERPEQILLEVELITGRYHQIRAQLASVGSPILGDTKYGSKDAWNFPGIALHHFHFEIPHPVTKEMLSFEVASRWE